MEQLAEKLAERVAEKAYEKFAAYVGRSILSKVWVIVLILAAGIVAAWKLYHDRT